MLRCLPHVSYGNIGRAFGLHRRSVGYYAKMLGFPPRVGGAYHKLSPEMAQEAADLALSGRPMCWVASTMGVTHNTLKRAINRLEE